MASWISSTFSVAKKLSATALSQQSPRRLMLQTIPCSFKAEAVRVVQASGKTVWAVARELDLTETALREWVRQTEIDAGRGQPGALTTDERAELAQLQREVENSRH